MPILTLALIGLALVATTLLLNDRAFVVRRLVQIVGVADSANEYALRDSEVLRLLPIVLLGGALLACAIFVFNDGVISAFSHGGQAALGGLLP